MRKAGRAASAVGALLVLGLLGWRWERASTEVSPNEAEFLSRAGLPDLSRLGPIDGIDVGDAAAFWRDWRLVTTRYRRDNGEQRFVYANPVGWRAIEQGAQVYPDGAMFGKVAFTTVDDASFPNSAEPRQFTRLQLMRKDTRRYATTGGWGYALLTAVPPAVKLDDRRTAAACHACHALVPERDYVFAGATFIGSGFRAELKSPRFKSRFHDVNTSGVTAFQRQVLFTVLANESLEKLGPVSALEMALFAGSANESIGVLDAFAVEDQKTYVVWDPASRHFAIARPLSPVPGCKTLSWVAQTTHSGTESTRPRVGTLCDGVWRR